MINRNSIQKILSLTGKNAPANSRLNILLIVPHAPYPYYTGGAKRCIEKIRYFGKRHKLTVIILYKRDRQKREIRKCIGRYCHKLVFVKDFQKERRNNTLLPEKINQVFSGRLVKRLQKIKTVFDVAMFERIYAAVYKPYVKARYYILDEHNIESDILRQYAGFDNSQTEIACHQAELMERFEVGNWPLFELRTVVSEQDRKEMQPRCNAGILVVENGVDSANIQPVKYNNSNTILFMGHLAYKPNIEAIKYLVSEIMPELHRAVPGLRLCIAGTTPTEEILALKKFDYIEIEADPVDMARMAERCCAAIVPLFLGGGTRIKILEAMAMGLPVISTTMGCEGLAVKNREHLLVCDTPGEFVDAVQEIKSSSHFRNELRKNGRYLVKTRYGWENIFRQYETVLLSKLAGTLTEQ